MNIYNQKGFSLAGVMVAAAILGIISMAALTVIGDIVAAGGKSKFDGEITNEIDVIRSNLKKSAICTLNLQGSKVLNGWTNVDSSKIQLRLPSTTDPTILGNILILGADPYLKEIQLRLEPGQTNLARARMRFDSKGKILGPPQVYREMILSVSLDPSSNLVTCSTEASNDNPHAAQGNGCSNGYPTQKSKLDNLCNSQNYPMKSFFSSSQLMAALGPSNGGGWPYGGTSLTLNPSVQRGKYKTASECKEQYVFSEGDVMRSATATTDNTLFCLNGTFVTISSAIPQAGGPNNSPNGSAGAGPGQGN